MDMPVADETLVFEGWRFERLAGDLFRQDASGTWVPVQIGSRALDILALLLDHPGALVSKDSIMDVAWPNVAVAPNNLTVQMAALRRVLDEGHAGDSYIQTVPGRGYRFVLPVTRAAATRPQATRPERTRGDAMSAPVVAPMVLLEPRTRHWRWLSAGLGGVVVIALLAGMGLHAGWFAGLPLRPRLSIVVLPFENLSDDRGEDYLADGITDDLTTALAQQLPLVVTARNTAFTYKAKSVDVMRVGNELGVRYAVEGSVRKVGTSLRVNVQLVSTETGAHLWAYQVDAAAATGGPGQDDFIWRISNDLIVQLIDIESARGARERPGNPDATDVLLQAYALQDTSGNPQQVPAVIALYERAVQLDPSSTTAIARLAIALVDNLNDFDDPKAPATLDRVEGLVAKAESLEPRGYYEMIARGYMLRWEGRGSEATAVLQNVIDNYPNMALGYHMLALSLLRAGRAAGVISNEQRSIQLNPHHPCRGPAIGSWTWPRFFWAGMTTQ